MLTDRELLESLLAGADLRGDVETAALGVLEHAQRRDAAVFTRIRSTITRGGTVSAKSQNAARLLLATIAVERLAETALGAEAAGFIVRFEASLRNAQTKSRFADALATGLLRRMFGALAAPAKARATLEEAAPLVSISLSSGPGSPGPSPEQPNHEEPAMSFYMDLRGLPPALGDAKAQEAYVVAVREQLKRVLGNVEPNALAHAAVVGKLLRGGQFRTDTGSFSSFVKRAYDDLVVPYSSRGGAVATGIEVLERIAAALAGGTYSGAAAAAGTSISSNGRAVAYQQLAFILDETIATLPVIAATDPGFRDRVERAYLDYASGDVGNDHLDIPSFDNTIDSDVIPENMLAVGKIYASYQLEQLKLFAVVDRVAELWRHGLLPIGSDSGGRLLNDYWWEREDRLSEANRASHYGRLFGMRGVDVSKEVQPNATFDSLMLRFLTNVAQYKRLTEMQVVSADPGQSKSLVSENVRKTGRELSANLSLYGWGATHFDASRIAGHVKVAFDIVKDAQVQKSFGVTTPWQVIERVAQQEFGMTPNVVKYQTMASSGQEIIRILASQPAAFLSSIEEIHQALKPAPQTFDTLARHALAWLSVAGTSTAQLAQLSQPIEAVSSPALPMLTPTPTSPTGASPDLTRLRDMMATGRMPSFEELRGFIN